MADINRRKSATVGFVLESFLAFGQCLHLIIRGELNLLEVSILFIHLKSSERFSNIPSQKLLN